ncbi:MAG: PfkB family carbohydrate kinase [Eubacteriales bacterium]|nr:PfkB family carbohydrate kinase [Eubacteriales bacterium]
MGKKCLVIGAAMLDIIMEIDRLPKSGEDVYAGAQSMTVGGCAYNVADIMKHFKVEHTFFAPVGTGMYAGFVEKELERTGHRSVVKSENTDNGYCLCMVEADGERTFLTLPGIECRFEKEWFDQLNAEEYDSVYVSGYELEGEGGSVILDFLEAHPELTVYYAPGPRITYISDEKRERMTALSPVVHLNEMEALTFTKKEEVEAAAYTLAKKTKNTVIVTLGAKGVYLMENGEGKVIPSAKAEVVDTIGAGDSHIGAIMSMRALGADFETAVRTANKVSAMVVGVKGPTLTAEEFEKGNLRNGKN